MFLSRVSVVRPTHFPAPWVFIKNGPSSLHYSRNNLLTKWNSVSNYYPLSYLLLFLEIFMQLFCMQQFTLQLLKEQKSITVSQCTSFKRELKVILWVKTNQIWVCLSAIIRLHETFITPLMYGLIFIVLFCSLTACCCVEKSCMKILRKFSFCVSQKKNNISVFKESKKTQNQSSVVVVVCCKTPRFNAFGRVASFAIVYYGFSFPFIRAIYKMFLWLSFNFPVSGCIAFH